RLVEERGIPCSLLPVESGFSRINVKIRAEEETALNGKGPEVTPAHLDRLWQQLETLAEGDFLVLSGSGPSGCAPSLYGDIAGKMHQRNIPCVVDATGKLLAGALSAHPFLVKPNGEELEDLLGRKLPDDKALIQGARELQERGARNVLISLGGDGALLVDETGKVHRHQAPKGTMVNTVGAGDSMVAGFLAGYLRNKDYGEALHWGICAGSATAFTMHLAEKEAIEQLVKGN
ncbi:hexose kinase, partial [Acidaminococcus fermentans]